MGKSIYSKKAENLLKDLEFYQSSLDYYRDIRDCAELTVDQHRAMSQKEKYISRTIDAVNHAMTLLNDTERDIVDKLYMKKEVFDDVCESCALERSSVYRYRSSAIRKIAKALYGAE